jgi:hypothetical protein
MQKGCKHGCLSRRNLLTGTAGGIGLTALLSMLKEDGALANVPGALKFAPTAKRCIFLFAEGGPSQFDLFSNKPTLKTLAGQKPPASLLMGKRFAFINANAVLLAPSPNRTFKQYGQSGLWFSNLVPNIAQHADKICMLNAVVTSQFNHAPAQLVMQTGHNLGGYPSMGSWILYGIGSENKNMPGYVVLTAAGFVSGGSASWSSGFVPSIHGGVLLQPTGAPILNLTRPPGISATIERDRLDVVSDLNLIHQQQMLDPEIKSRIDNYELSFRMQAEAPPVFDLSGESQATLDRYGINRADPAVNFGGGFKKPPDGFYGRFAKQCLLARRLVEKGVRFVNVYSGSWDAHGDLTVQVEWLSRGVDQPIAALLQDLSDRGLLDETLVVWGTEFGRTPLGQGTDGRDHHPDAFPIFMAGGGVKPGFSFGETDDIGFSPVKDAVDVSDLHATILRMFGIDHMALSYPYRGVDQRLTPLTRVSKVIDQILK